MKTSFQVCALVLICGFVSPAASAALRYVNVNSATPTAPYTNWSTAATVIQDAIDVAEPGDEIVVTDGVYQIGGREVSRPESGTSFLHRVAVTQPVIVRSVNGAELTIIDAAREMRCVYLSDGATLVGFTLSNGVTGTPALELCPGEVQCNSFQSGGGGAWCEGASSISNCIFSGNIAFRDGGGVYGGNLDKCIFKGNSAWNGGASAYANLNDCLVSGNTAGNVGGGTYFGMGNNCTLVGNSARSLGGGCFATYLNGSVVTSNRAATGGGAFGGSMNNCTITANSASDQAGGVSGTGFFLVWCDADPDSDCYDYSGDFYNCIVYYNDAPVAPNFYFNLQTNCNYSCTTPLPSSGVGNITNAPLFIDPTAGNFRLQSNSPCINAGLNYAAAGPDLDGNPRIAGGTVDMGGYEFQKPTSSLSYAWLEHFGLPTDGSADSADTDGDGCNNWQEWRAGTDPTNSLSVLRLLSPMLSSDGLVVRWQSVTDRTYRLERTTNLTQGSFEAIASNIVGQASVTAYIDANAETNRVLFYRLRVEE